jgi:FemAB-related protein (PEP-CTERM system-associated)
MKVVTVENAQDEWDRFVLGHRDATSYHRFAWQQTLVRSFGHPCYYLASVDGEGKWHGVLPLIHMQSRMFGNFLVSLPFLNYGGLLCQNDEAKALLLEEAERLRRSCGAEYVELRHVASQSGHLRTKQHKVTMVLTLAGTEQEQWKAFDPKLRNQIRKAQKSGLRFRHGRLDLLDDFYEVFARNMRDLGTPVYAKRFFENILKAFPDTTCIFVVVREARTIAAGIASWFRDRFEVPWASSLREFKSLCPNNMLYWEAIRFAIAKGFQEFDFGRSTPDEGTYHFKKQWGAVAVPLHWQYLIGERGSLPSLSPDNPKYRIAIRVWQGLPVSLTKLIGPSIVRNIP